MKIEGCILVPLFLACFASLASTQQLPPAPGPYCPLSATEVNRLASFQSGDRVVGTYYFYWYKWKDACIESVCNPTYTRSHIEFATGTHGAAAPTDALTDHPPDLEEMDFADSSWHRAQLERIASASIDMVLPVFWGVPGRYGEDGHYVAKWSAVGLEALARALETLESEGKRFPRVGMFYDTSTLGFESPFHFTQGRRDLDLTTAAGKSHFYGTIRDFFSLVPPRFWALWKGRPLVWLYSSEFAGGYDHTLLVETKVRFASDFAGLQPWFVANLDWSNEVSPDWVYRWGGAIFPSYLSVNVVGPGFDNSGALGKPRGSNVLRDRAETRFYRDSWERALRTISPVTVIETWNELHEGTEICPTVEYGDEFLRITGDYAAAFKQAAPHPPLPGPYQQNAGVKWSGSDPLPGGMELVDAEDGKYRLVTSGTETVLETRSPYLYFAVDDSFCFQTQEPMDLTVEYFDLPERAGTVKVEYDSWDRSGTLHGVYRASESEPLSGSFKWKRQPFALPMARLANNQNQGADFRLVVPMGLRIRSVELTKTN